MTSDDLSMEIHEEIHVKAPIGVTFAALLEQLGPLNEPAPNYAMPMKLEAWPGGKWTRDLGSENGHFWAHVQAIKRPTLIEFCGPLIMSYAATSNLQYRWSEEPGGTLIKFRHAAFGLIQDDHRAGVRQGWAYTHARMKERVEASAARAR
jgi:Activator of Hsp90 ATPase homolog 1-like protein